MKNPILTFSITNLLVIICLTMFGQENKKSLEIGKSIAIKDKKEMVKCPSYSDAEYNEYRKEADIRIFTNKIKLTNLKVNQPIHNHGNNKVYNKKILVLEQRNNFLKNKIGRPLMTKTCTWSTFKSDFSDDMDELECQIKSIEIN